MQGDAVCGYTDTYVPVMVSGAKEGQLVEVTVTRTENGVCYGKSKQVEE